MPLRLTTLENLPPVWSAHGISYSQDGGGDVLVRFAPVPGALVSPRLSRPRIDVDAGDCLLRIPPDVRIRACGGCQITIDAPAATDLVALAAWLHGPATIAILYQRGLTPLHASAVDCGEGIIAFLAPSGIGKSSLAACMVDSGARLVTDDVLAVSAEPGGRVVGFPGPGLLRLSAEAHGRIGPRGLRTLDQGSDGKVVLAPEEVIRPGPRPFRAIFLLSHGAAFGAVSIRGTGLLCSLRVLLQRPAMAAFLGEESAILESLGGLASSVAAWRLTRPRTGWTLSESRDCVMQLLSKTGPGSVPAVTT